MKVCVREPTMHRYNIYQREWRLPVYMTSDKNAYTQSNPTRLPVGISFRLTAMINDWTHSTSDPRHFDIPWTVKNGLFAALVLSITSSIFTFLFFVLPYPHPQTFRAFVFIDISWAIYLLFPNGIPFFCYKDEKREKAMQFFSTTIVMFVTFKYHLNEWYKFTRLKFYA